MGLFEKKYHGWSWFTPLKCSYVRWSLNCKLLDYWLRIFLKYGFITFYLKVGTPIHPMDDGIICPATWHHIVASHDIRIPISPGSYPEMFRMFRFLSNVSYYIHSIHIYIVLYNYNSHFSFIYYPPPDWRNTVSKNLSTGWFTKNPPDSGHLATALHGDSEIPTEGPHQAEGAAFKSSWFNWMSRVNGTRV